MTNPEPGSGMWSPAAKRGLVYAEAKKKTDVKRSMHERRERPSVAAVTDADGRRLNHQANVPNIVSRYPCQVVGKLSVPRTQSR